MEVVGLEDPLYVRTYCGFVINHQKSPLHGHPDRQQTLLENTHRCNPNSPDQKTLKPGPRGARHNQLARGPTVSRVAGDAAAVTDRCWSRSPDARRRG